MPKRKSDPDSAEQPRRRSSRLVEKQTPPKPDPKSRKTPSKKKAEKAVEGEKDAEEQMDVSLGEAAAGEPAPTENGEKNGEEAKTSMTSGDEQTQVDRPPESIDSPTAATPPSSTPVAVPPVPVAVPTAAPPAVVPTAAPAPPLSTPAAPVAQVAKVTVTPPVVKAPSLVVNQTDAVEPNVTPLPSPAAPPAINPLPSQPPLTMQVTQASIPASAAVSPMGEGVIKAAE